MQVFSCTRVFQLYKDHSFVFLGEKMTSEQKHHEELVSGFYNQLKEIFDSSEQGIYLYLDDNHKVCNKKFANMQGFSSPEEWAKVDDPLEAGVAKSSQDAIVSAYKNAMEKQLHHRLMLS